jgi:hypothetical protein
MAEEELDSRGRRDSTLESPDLDVEFNWSKSLDESSTDGVLGLETNLDPTLDVLDVSREQGEDEAVDDPVSCYKYGRSILNIFFAIDKMQLVRID